MTERLEAARGDVEKQVNDTNKRIKGEEELIDGINQSGTKVTADANRLRDTIKTLESNCEKCEEDKSTKDNQIHTLREEIAHQEELISKLQKEKKGAGEGRQKAEEDIQAMEDRCNHLSKVKRKIEGNLKLTQEAVGDLDRIKADLAAGLQRKEKELMSMSAKIEDEGTLGSKYNKQVKELQSRIEELDEELHIERQNRAKAEKNRTTLSRDIQDLGGRLEEAGSNTSTQIELNKKREAELLKL